MYSFQINREKVKQNITSAIQESTGRGKKGAKQKNGNWKLKTENIDKYTCKHNIL